MAVLFTISEGWTQRLKFYIEAKLPGQTAFTPLPILPGYAVEFGWRRGGNAWGEAPGDFEIVEDQEADPGACYYYPADADDFAFAAGLTRESFFVRAVVTDSDGKIVNAPSGAAAEIVVHRK